jgi:hypothetical protein
MSALARMGERISVGPDLPAFAAMSEEIGTGLLFEEEAPEHYTTFVAGRFSLCRLLGMINRIAAIASPAMRLPCSPLLMRRLSSRHASWGSEARSTRDVMMMADFGATHAGRKIPLPSSCKRWLLRFISKRGREVRSKPRLCQHGRRCRERCAP